MIFLKNLLTSQELNGVHSYRCEDLHYLYVAMHFQRRHEVKQVGAARNSKYSKDGVPFDV